LGKPINVKGDAGKKTSPNSTETEFNVTEVQLVIDWSHERVIFGAEKFQNMTNKNVVIKGKLLHSFTAHHHKKILISVDKVMLNS